MRTKVFVVEGKNDASRLYQILGDVKVVTTNGSEISQETIDLLKALDQTHDLILFLDPDYPGQRIRSKLEHELTHVAHAHIQKKDGISKNRKKVGIEHATDEVILEALKHIQYQNEETRSDIDNYFLYQTNLVGAKNSKAQRIKLAKKMHLGHVNGKTLLYRLQMFGMTTKDVIEVLNDTSS
jgi:ribonuclease M5